MTTPNPADPMAPALPGIDPPAAPQSDLEKAVDRTLRELYTSGLITERHAGIAELCRVMARTVSIGVQSRRSSGAALAAKELREALAMLPTPPEGTGAVDEWEALARKLHEASDGHPA